MGKYIDRDEVIKLIKEDKNKTTLFQMFAKKNYPDGNAMFFRGVNYTCDRLIKAIKGIHAADVRPVVLCRDCKHKGWVQEPEHGRIVDYCRLIERCVDKQFFCAAGERKTNCGVDMRGAE